MKSWRRSEEGYLLCDGDCRSWSLGVCTCGLVHHLIATVEGAEEIYEALLDHHEHALGKLEDLERNDPRPPSQRTTKLLREKHDG